MTSEQIIKQIGQRGIPQETLHVLGQRREGWQRRGHHQERLGRQQMAATDTIRKGAAG